MPLPRRSAAGPAAALACLALAAAAPAAEAPRNLSDVPQVQRLVLPVNVTEAMRSRKAPAVVTFTLSQPASVQCSVYDPDKVLAFAGREVEAAAGRPVRVQIGQWSSTRAAGSHLLVFRVVAGGPAKLPRLALRQVGLVAAVGAKEVDRITSMSVDPGAGNTGGKFTVNYKLGLASSVRCEYYKGGEGPSKPTQICDDGPREAGTARSCDWTAPGAAGTYFVRVVASPLDGGEEAHLGQQVPISK